MELAQKSFTNDIFREYRVKYEHIILVAGDIVRCTSHHIIYS